MVKLQTSDGRAVFVNPDHVTHVEDNGENNGCTLYLTGGKNIWFSQTAAHIVGWLDTPRR